MRFLVLSDCPQNDPPADRGSPAVEQENQAGAFVGFVDRHDVCSPVMGRPFPSPRRGTVTAAGERGGATPTALLGILPLATLRAILDAHRAVPGRVHQRQDGPADR